MAFLLTDFLASLAGGGGGGGNILSFASSNKSLLWVESLRCHLANMLLFDFGDGVASFYKTIMFENDLAFQLVSYVSKLSEISQLCMYCTRRLTLYLLNSSNHLVCFSCKIIQIRKATFEFPFCNSLGFKLSLFHNTLGESFYNLRTYSWSIL